MMGDGGNDAMTRQGMQGTMDYFRQNANNIRSPISPAKMGLTEEEYAERKAQVARGFKVKKEKGNMTVKSSAKMQQDLTAGTAEKVINARREEIKVKYTYFNYARYTGMFVCAVCLGLLVKEVMMPIVELHYYRRLRMQRRHEEVFLPAMQRLHEERQKAIAEGREIPMLEERDQDWSEPPKSI